MNWSLLSASPALAIAYTYVQWVVSLVQSLGLRGTYLASSEPLQKNKLRRQDNSQQSPKDMGRLSGTRGKVRDCCRGPKRKWRLNEPGHFCPC